VLARVLVDDEVASDVVQVVGLGDRAEVARVVGVVNVSVLLAAEQHRRRRHGVRGVVVERHHDAARVGLHLDVVGAGVVVLPALGVVEHAVAHLGQRHVELLRGCWMLVVVGCCWLLVFAARERVMKGEKREKRYDIAISHTLKRSFEGV
jgi:hypothetical protein